MEQTIINEANYYLDNNLTIEQVDNDLDISLEEVSNSNRRK